MLIGLWRPFVYNLGCLGLMWAEENRTGVVLTQYIELMGTEVKCQIQRGNLTVRGKV